MGSQSVMGYVGTRLSSIWRKENFTAVGRPEEITANGKFFRVKPANFAVQDVIFFALFSIFIFALIFFLVEQRMFTFFVGNGMEIQIALAHKSRRCSPSGENLGSSLASGDEVSCTAVPVSRL